MTALLQLKGVQKAFGNVVVCDALTYDLASEEALGVIGPNGAGKTSMFNLIAGTLPADGGQIFYNGGEITRTPAPVRCRSGISRSFQVPQPFGGMTVFENGLVAACEGAGMGTHEANDYCIEVLDQTGLLSKANSRAGNLTLLERKRLELTRALCTKPKLLLLDEIAGGLTEGECQSLVQTIKDIRSTGISIIWIEHVVHALLAVVDRLIVIDFGKLLADGEPHAVMARDDVREIYLGIEADA